MANQRILEATILRHSGVVEALSALGELDTRLARVLANQADRGLDPYKILERCDCPNFFRRLYRWGKLTFFASPSGPDTQEVGRIFVFALSRGRLGVARWIKDNFALCDANLNGAMYDAAYGGDTETIKWLTRNFKVNWERLRSSTEDPFWAALVGNHLSAVSWLADHVYPNQKLALDGDWNFFRDLFALNNLSAVKWLLDRYDIGIGSILKPGVDASVFLYEMMASGRPEMARYLSRHYGVALKVGSVEDAQILGIGKLPPAQPWGHDTLVALLR